MVTDGWGEDILGVFYVGRGSYISENTYLGSQENSRPSGLGRREEDQGVSDQSVNSSVLVLNYLIILPTFWLSYCGQLRQRPNTVNGILEGKCLIFRGFDSLSYFMNPYF